MTSEVRTNGEDVLERADAARIPLKEWMQA